jgi:hypothetical protein
VISAYRLAPLVVVVVAILAGIHAIDPSPVGVFYDDAHYVILGRSLSLGEGYRYLNVPGAPAATHFPPGYPMLLALLWRISPVFPENVALFKMVNALLLGGVAFGVYHAARRLIGAGPLAASLTALAGTAAIPALLLSSSVMSEVLFLSLLLPLLVRADQLLTRGSGTRMDALILGIGAGVLCLIRTHGVVLIPALAFGYASRRRFAHAGIAAAAAVLVLAPWLLWVRHFDSLVPPALRGQYGSYGSWIAEGLRANGVGLLVASLRDNLVTSYAIVARSFSLARQGVLDALAVLAVLTLLGAGAFTLARRATVTIGFVALYLGIVLVWPFSPLRFVWGVWPLLVLLMVGGGMTLWRRTDPGRMRRVARALVVATCAVALAGALNFNVRGYANSWWATVSRSFAPRIQPQLVWVTEKTGHADVIVTDDEGAVYLYTGRRALPPNTFTVEQYFRPRSTEENARWLSAIVRAFDPAYVVAWAKPTLDAAALLSSQSPPLLVQVDTIPTGRVYRRAQGAPASR